MGLLNWIFDFYQQDQIEQAKRGQAEQRWEVLEELAAAREQAAALQAQTGYIDVAKLSEAIGELALSVKALQRLLVRNGTISASELTAMVSTVDREDGVEDGRTPV